MIRTKWMRLGVHAPADILRWAGAQNARHLDDFRHRMIHGREYVSFRMVPRYAIEIGVSDIVVIAHVKGGVRLAVAAVFGTLWRRTARRMSTTIAALKSRVVVPQPARTAELYQLAALRR